MKILFLVSLAFLLVIVSAQQIRLLQHDQKIYHKNILCKNWYKQRRTCLECFQGCTKWQNICVRIVKNCASWDMQGNCAECEMGYGDQNQKSINGSCPKQVQGPIMNMTDNTTDNVTNLTTIDLNCQCHNDDRDCIDCYAGYYLDIDNFCMQLPENCSAADPEGNCTNCLSGFAVEDGQCVEQQCDLSLCRSFNENQTQCQTCPSRAYLQDGCCILVNGYCQEWVQQNGVCLKCYTGYKINKNNNKECIIE